MEEKVGALPTIAFRLNRCFRLRLFSIFPRIKQFALYKRQGKIFGIGVPRRNGKTTKGYQ